VLSRGFGIGDGDGEYYTRAMELCALTSIWDRCTKAMELCALMSIWDRCTIAMEYDVYLTLEVVRFECSWSYIVLDLMWFLGFYARLAYQLFM
jgi:hypothetical protein